MSYYVNKTVDATFEQVMERTQEKLKDQGFGVLTEIDVQKTLKEKIGVDFKRYQILGACNPNLAFEALLAENNVGAMLPCNVVVSENDNNSIEVSVVDPVASMMAIDNDQLLAIARYAREKLRLAIAEI